MKRKINHRADEPSNPHSYQITFRTTRELSGAWSSLRGLCKKYGRNESSAELFRDVVVPAMQRFISASGYLERAKADRLAGEFEQIFR